MSLLANSNQTPSIVPIVLAGDSNLDAWPHSRIHIPLQFQRGHNKTSLFGQTLACIDRLPQATAPVVALAPKMLEQSREQLIQAGIGETSQIVVEPVDRGTWPAGIIAALKASQLKSDALLMFIDAANPPADTDAFCRLVVQIQASETAAQSLVFCGQPGRSAGHGMCVSKTGKTDDPLLFRFKQMECSEQENIFGIGSLAFAPADTFLRMVEHIDPETLATCKRALDQSQRLDGAIWPDLNLWSALKPQNFSRQCTSRRSSALLRPVDLGVNTADRQAQLDTVFDTACTNCHIESDGHIVAVAGCSDLDIIATVDATLVVHKDCRYQVSSLVERMRLAQRPEVFDFPIKRRSWGQERELDRRDGHRILRLDIEPGKEILPHFHTHRTESWTVLSGQGEAMVDGTVHPLARGKIVQLQKHGIHSCRNTGTATLSLLETRMGNFLSDADSTNTKQMTPPPWREAV